MAKSNAKNNNPPGTLYGFILAPACVSFAARYPVIDARKGWLSAFRRLSQDRQVVPVRSPYRDEVSVLDFELAGYLPDFAVFDAADRLVRRGDREETVEQRHLLVLSCDVVEFACDQIVLGRAKENALSLGHLNNT